MDTTSHFIGIELKNELFSNFFVQIYTYIQEHNIEESLVFQNPLSMHITLYYLEKNLAVHTKKEMKKYIEHFDIHKSITVKGLDYFYNGIGERSVLYFPSITSLPLEVYRDDLHMKYNRKYVEDNNFPFSPHITFLRILNADIFEAHRENIEQIIHKEISQIQDVDINRNKMYLYGVNSNFREEIQIKL